MSRDRGKRRLRILEIISARRIATQQNLAKALSAEGWPVTQSSVSRDIRDLGLIKVGGCYRKPHRGTVGPGPDEQRLRESILMVQRAGENLVVVHTPPGEAQRVAVAIDRFAWAEVVGTVAGDDTLFIAVADGKGAQALMRRLSGGAARA